MYNFLLKIGFCSLFSLWLIFYFLFILVKGYFFVISHYHDSLRNQW